MSGFDPFDPNNKAPFVKSLPSTSPHAKLLAARPEDASQTIPTQTGLAKGLFLQGFKENDPIKQATILAANILPELYKQNPDAAIQRFGLKEGEWYFVDPTDEKVRKLSPDILRPLSSPQNEVGSLAQISGAGTPEPPAWWQRAYPDFAKRVGLAIPKGVSENLEEIGGTAAEIGVGLKTRSPQLGAAAGGGTLAAIDMAKQAVGEWIYQNAKGSDVDIGKVYSSIEKTDAALDGGLFWLASQPFLLGAKLLSKNPLKIPSDSIDVARQQGRRWVDDLQVSEKQNIPMTVGQASEQEGLLIRERAIARQPEAATKFARFFEQQFENITNRLTKDLLPRLGKVDLTQSAVLAMKKSAEGIIEQAKKLRTRETSQYFEEAFGSGVRPDVSAVIKNINSRLKNAAEGGATQKSLIRVRKLLQQARMSSDEATALGHNKPPEPLPNDNFQALHDAKMNVDGMIADLIEGTKGNEAKAALFALENVQKRLVTILTKSHPSYAKGMREYQRLSGPIEKMNQGPLGVLARMNATDVTGAQQLGNVFNAFRVSSPSVIRQLKTKMDDAGDGHIFDAGFRSYLAGVLEQGLKRQTSQGLASHLHTQLFVTPNQRQVFKAAVKDTNLFKDFKNFFDIMNKIKKTKSEGSPTATDLGIASELAGLPAKVAGTVTRPFSIMQSAQEWLLKASTSRQAGMLADLYTTKAGQQALRKTRNLKPGTAAYLAALKGVIMIMSGASETRKSVENYPE